eukprot:g7366.t1
MDDELYDEFGNYIGPELASSGDEEPEDDGFGAAADGNYGDFDDDVDDGGAAADDGGAGDDGEDVDETAIVLHEDKQFYPDASEVYPEAQTVVMEEDAQPLEQPIIAPVRTRVFSALEKEVPGTSYSTEFMASLMGTPESIRNVAVIGHLHHGKTVFMDSLVEHTHDAPWDAAGERRYTDARHDEQQRELSVKVSPVSLVLQSTAGKSHLLNLVDCPGHPTFVDEAVAGLRAADGAVLVVDAVEGVMLGTELHARRAVQAGCDVVLLITKVDRLILELKLPPADAYQKLRHTVGEVNALLQSAAPLGATPPVLLSPERGNVAFCSAKHRWSFTLASFASAMYTGAGPGAGASRRKGQGKGKGKGGDVDACRFARRLWGDWYFNAVTRGFSPKPVAAEGAPQPKRAFVQFVLEPLYKVYSAVLGERAPELNRTLRRLGVRLSRQQLHMDTGALLRLALRGLLGAPTGIVDMVREHVLSPVRAAPRKVALTYTGAGGGAGAAAAASVGPSVGPGPGPGSSLEQAMARCRPDGPLMVNIVKLLPSPDGSSFSAFGRVLSGSVRAGDRVRVLGEAYTLEDDEDMALCEVSRVSVAQARYTVEVSEGAAGALVLLDGIDGTIGKTATVTDATGNDDACTFRPLQHGTIPTMKLAVEPLKPAELPKMLDGLRKVSKTFPLLETHVEESGEHVLLGAGELFLDCAMHDLRRTFAEVEVKVADPSVRFRETVSEASSLQCHAATPNGRSRLVMQAEPLDAGLAEDIEAGAVSTAWDKRAVGEFFRSRYDWDLLASRNVWSFGPDAAGPNVLIDDTLPGDVDKGLLRSCREHIVQGFQWGCREGPLCDEPVRGAKFRLVGAEVAAEAMQRGGGQVIPTARRVAYSAFLLSAPRLMEPIYRVEINAPADVVPALGDILMRRRGHVVQDAPKPGSPMYVVKAFLPVIDSFGFETDLRSYTHGQAMCLQTFDHWAVVPGDPLDSDIVLHPLEPSPVPHLAREFMVKTRCRKGLSADVSINKFFDESMLAELEAQKLADAEMDE